jgi:membrane protein YqaA with SNARE-associated domain
VNDWAAYASMFFAALFAATLLPAQSEAVLAGLLVLGNQPVWLLILIASVGNTAGSSINWLMGLYLEHFRHRRWFPISDANLTRAQNWYHRYGKWSLLLSWVPIIGDPLTLAAGIMRERFLVFVSIVALAKTGRYLGLALLTLGFT